MPSRFVTPLAAAIAALLISAPALAAETALPEVVVTGDKPESGPLVVDPQPAPRTSVNRQGMDLFGGPAQTSLYAPLDAVPSVNVQSPDPYGLSTTRNLNIRGKSDFHTTRNVEGLPLTGIVGGADLFDLENVGRIDVYRGSLQANQGLGISNAAGVVDQRLLAPRERFAAFGKQALGSYDFRKTFVRLDSGNLAGSGTRVFISGSATASDKWKGAGDLSRDNFMLGLSQNFGDRIKADLYYVDNRYSGHTFRPLSYAQARSIDTNYKYDYGTTFTGAGNSTYYGFNRAHYDNWAALANIEVKLAAGHRVVIKPYYWHDDGYTYSASGANVQIWRQQNTNAGGVLEYQGRLGAGLDLVAGYWRQSMAPPPPPTDQRLFTVRADGSLAFSRWSTLAKIDHFEVVSPYAQLTGTLGQTVITGGVREMRLGAPRMEYYNTAGLKDATHDAVWSQNPVAYADALVAAKTYSELLPSLGIRHAFGPEWSGSLSYGRKFGRPDWGPQASNYIGNRADFQAHGISLQALVDKVRPETSDQIDFGAQYTNGRLTLSPTLFYAKNKNRQVQINDTSLPKTGGGYLSYYQGATKTTQYGLELEGDYRIGDAWSVFGSATLAKETYDEDTTTLSGGVQATRSKQIPNAPRAMLKGGATYRTGALSVSPILRYVGPRYGDSIEAERVPGYAVFDINARYGIDRHLRIELSALNLFDKRYISEIAPADFTLTSSSSYYAGAPRTAVVVLSAEF